MYKQRPIFGQKSNESEKSYLRKLLGRMNRLKKMVKRRNEEVLPTYQLHIDEIDLEIEKLQEKKKKWISKKRKTLTELDEIRNELNTYLNSVEPLLDNEDVSPTFQIRELPRELKSGQVEIYFEGRVRGRMVKGYRSKDYTKQFGTTDKVRDLLKKEFGLEMNNLTPYDKNEYLKQILKREWLEDMGTTSL